MQFSGSSVQGDLKKSGVFDVENSSPSNRGINETIAMLSMFSYSWYASKKSGVQIGIFCIRQICRESGAQPVLF
jgi:hypothetical protein